MCYTAIGDLSKSKKLRNCAALNAEFLPLILTKDVLFEGEEIMGELLKIFAFKSMDHGLSSATNES